MIKENTIAIIDYLPEHQAVFKAMNLQWLDNYNLTESHDLMVLNDPQGTIIERGGRIFLAVADGQVVGSAAIMKEDESVFELAKMTVAPSHQGRGLSHLLIARCIDEAKKLGAQKIILFSNHQLTTAISLYEKYGFRRVALGNSPFVTADVRMELLF